MQRPDSLWRHTTKTPLDEREIRPHQASSGKRIYTIFLSVTVGFTTFPKPVISAKQALHRFKYRLLCFAVVAKEFFSFNMRSDLNKMLFYSRSGQWWPVHPFPNSFSFCITQTDPDIFVLILNELLEENRVRLEWGDFYQSSVLLSLSSPAPLCCLWSPDLLVSLCSPAWPHSNSSAQ